MLLRIAIAFPLFMHGIAHLGGFLASWVENRAGFEDEPWLYSKSVTLQSPVGRGISTLWLVAMLALVGTALGVIFQQKWWPILAIIGAMISLDNIVTWWRAVPLGAKLGAAFDLLIILAVAFPWRESIVALIN
jgi:hypothetical protein